MEGFIIALVKTIYEYIKEPKKVDSTFYEKMWKIMYSSIYGKNLKQCVFIEEHSKNDPDFFKYVNKIESIIGLAAFNREEKELIIYEFNMDSSNTEKVNELELNDNDKIIMYNLLCLQTLLHEYEHIVQDFKVDYVNDFETDMLNYIGFESDTLETYDYSLKERLAELNSLRNIIFVMDKLNINPIIYDYFYKRIIDTQKQGYIIEDDIFKSPNEKYLELIGDNPDKAHWVKADDMDTRIKFGLPVSYEDYLKYIKQEEKDCEKVLVLE